jgi:hypothetical protein
VMLGERQTRWVVAFVVCCRFLVGITSAFCNMLKRFLISGSGPLVLLGLKGLG